MATEYSGSGDPKRSIELLWGIPGPPRRGPKPRFTVEQIVAEATELADAEGLAALSMRRVADRLGVTAMSLYGYFPGKAELLDVMVDRAFAEVSLPDTIDAHWRVRLAHSAQETWSLFHRHPWLLHVAMSRPGLGPAIAAKYEYELSAVDGIGLTDVEMDLVVTLVSDYVQGTARTAVEAAQAVQRTGKTDVEWWEPYAPLLAEVVIPERYPVATRVGVKTGEEYGAARDSQRAFEFGLQRVLDGIESLVDA